MSRAIQREIVFPQPREQVWRAATGSAILAEWMHPNGMEARVGHRFTFRVPPNPRQVSKAWPWAPKCWNANRPAGSCSRGRPQLGAPPHPPSTRKSSRDIMKQETKRPILRWIHIIFGLPILGSIYGPAGEVQQYAPMFRYVFVPVLVLSGLWMWRGHLVPRLFPKNPA